MQVTMIRTLLFFFLFLVSCSYVYAQTCTLTLRTGTVNFGTFNPFQASSITGVNQRFAITCFPSGRRVNYSLTLSAGGDNSYAPFRHMLINGTGPEVLNYNFYTTAGLATIWGDGTSGTSFIQQNNVRCRFTSPCVHTAYGRIPAPQPMVTGGSYSAQITATLTYN